MSLEKKSETKRGGKAAAAAAARSGSSGGVGGENGGGTGHPWRGGQVDAPVLPRLAVERTRIGQ